MIPRLACVDLPALPLQLLRRAHPEWSGHPVVVLEADEPRSPILFVDRVAASYRIRPGMRFASALSLASNLRAVPLHAIPIAECNRELITALTEHAPRVEADVDHLGVHWIDPRGMSSLFGPLERWAERVYAKVRSLSLEGAVVVGFARLPTWAVARQRKGAFVIATPAEERMLAGRSPLAILDLPTELRDALWALGIDTIARFLELPRGQVSVRFGTEAAALHAQLAAELHRPLAPEEMPDPIVVEAELDPPDDDLARLLFCLKGALHALMAELARRSLALRSLELRLELERGEPHDEVISPSRPGRDVAGLLELVRLRLSSVVLSSRVERLIATAEPSSPEAIQLSLFSSRRKDPDAAARGLARLRAAFGPAAVTRACLRDAWFPEHTYAWEPIEDVGLPRVREGEPRLVRRMLEEPLWLSQDARGRPLTTPALRDLAGPYRLQGQWWSQEIARDYFYGEREDGALLWLYRDRVERQWFMQALIE